jgi:hypothetical protein
VSIFRFSNVLQLAEGGAFGEYKLKEMVKVLQLAEGGAFGAQNCQAATKIIKCTKL